MPEFDEMLAAVRADCATRPLPEAEELRHIGSRRTHRRRVLVTGTVAVAVTGVAVAAALVIPGRVASQQPVGPATTSTSTSASASASGGPAPVGTSAGAGAPSSPSAPGSLTSAGSSDSSTSPSSSNSPTPTTPTAPSTTPPSISQIGGTPPTCQATQLGPNPLIHRGVAGGSLGITVTFTNQSTTACRLDNSVALWHAEPGQAPALVPTTSGGNYVPVLAPGGKGTALIQWVDGYGGYSTSAPECAHPTHYHGLYLVDAGAKFTLPGITLDVLCGGVSADWTLS
ncbi:hypothetical protein ABH920_003751 [Catenulispora sp. EB89]|uniref:DUF4232 domain-containing protein n=1 Tax=Catenulispora sp. EB89 TaxID=3156257 RepID=UPI0035169758